MKRRSVERKALVGLMILAFAFCLWGLETFPPLWWDEGWTLTAARTWVERGQYGQLLEGEPAPPGLSAASPVVTLVALAFRLWGVGAWQGRLIMGFFTLGALLVLYKLTACMSGRRLAWGTLAVLLLMPLNPDLHSFIMGRQVLGEMVMMAYLLVGYFCFFRALQKPWGFMPLAWVFWGVTLLTKTQVKPFWGVSLALPLLVALWQHRWKYGAFLTISLFGTLGVTQGLLWLQSVLIPGVSLSTAPVEGLYEVTAWVPVFAARIQTIGNLLDYGWLTTLGLGYAAWRLWKKRKEILETDRGLLRLTLWTLSTSWFGWYLVLSVGWPRYFFPVFFTGAPFVAEFLRALTGGRSFRALVACIAEALKRLRLTRESAGALLGLFLITWVVTLTLQQAYFAPQAEDGTAVFAVADFLNSQTPPGSVVETYESELFFLLDRPYHYPPDEIHVLLNRRTFLKEALVVDYDPLMADPDYLVVGKFEDQWGLYAPTLAGGAFREVSAAGPYRIYERVR